MPRLPPLSGIRTPDFRKPIFLTSGILTPKVVIGKLFPAPHELKRYFGFLGQTMMTRKLATST
jgi:hypothetical protein